MSAEASYLRCPPGVDVGLFSDDTTASTAFLLDVDPHRHHGQALALDALSSWAISAESWLIRNRVKPNVDKSVFMYTSSPYRSLLVRPDPLNVHNSTLSPVTECIYLGVTIDWTLTMVSHIRNECRNAFFHLHRIGKIRRYLDAPSTKLLVRALGLSRLDYCNESFAGLPKSARGKMQRVLNCSARLALRARRREHTIRHHKYLNWLPINQRLS